MTFERVPSHRERVQRREVGAGSEGVGIHRTYPYLAYGGLAPVPGGQGEQRDDIANPIQVYLNIGWEKG